MDNSIVPSNARYQSPFDAIRQTDDRGTEFWSARALMPILGYAKWQHFGKNVKKATVSCRNAGNPVAEHFLPTSVTSGSGHKFEDWKLSRYGCYLVSMNCDPEKPEVAAAQSYFAVKTREAELKDAQESSTLALPPVDIRITSLVASLDRINLLDNPRHKQVIQDFVMDKMLGATVLPASKETLERWIGVAELAEEMGYPVALVGKNRSALGKFVATFDLVRTQEKRLCNGTMRPINLYLDCSELRSAISEFMDAKVLTTK